MTQLSIIRHSGKPGQLPVYQVRIGNNVIYLTYLELMEFSEDIDSLLAQEQRDNEQYWKKKRSKEVK